MHPGLVSPLYILVPYGCTFIDHLLDILQNIILWQLLKAYIMHLKN
jgi:hypothetical protein